MRSPPRPAAPVPLRPALAMAVAFGGACGASRPAAALGLVVAATGAALLAGRTRSVPAAGLARLRIITFAAALAGLRAAALATPAPAKVVALPHAATVHALSARGDEDLLSLEGPTGGGPAWAVARGSTAIGERIALVRAGRLVPLPAGPEPGPAARAGRDAAERVVAPGALVRLDAAPAWSARARRILAEWRERAARRFDALGDARIAALCGAATLGLDRPRDEQGDAEASDERIAADRDLFTRTGTRHLLAVSGLHVGLLVALALRPLALLLTRWGDRRRRTTSADLLLASLLLVFMVLAGARAPVQRAGLAVLAALCCAHVPVAHPRARRLGATRRVAPLDAWALALLVECAAHPAAALDLSLQLSYGATFGLIVWTAPFTRRLRALFTLSHVTADGRPRGSLWQRPLERAARLFATALAASLAANVVTTPIVLACFGECSPWGILITPLAVPLFAGFLTSSFAHLVVPGDWFAATTRALAHALLVGLELCDRLPATPLALPPRPALFSLAAAVLAAHALAHRRALRSAAFLAGLLLLPWRPAPAGLELHALDVGHGTAVLARAPGLPALVFDAGSRDRPRVADEAVLPLLAMWDPAALVVVASHGDRDHAGALERIAHRRRLAAWIGAPPPTALEHAARLDLDAPGWLTLLGRGPLCLHLGRGATSADNEGSRDLLLEYRARDGEREWLLLCGDAEAAGRERLTSTLPAAAEQLALLLMPHHGTARETLGPLLERSPPRQAWISRADPAPCAAELARRGIAQRSTAIEGRLEYRAGAVRTGLEPRILGDGTEFAENPGRKP